MTAHYSLRCLLTGTEFDDVDLPLANPLATKPAFLRATYRQKRFAPDTFERGLYRFIDWLPIQRTLDGSNAPITYQSTRLAAHLGLERLFITFSGYWPDRGVKMLTGTFKECEAFSVCARIPADFRRTLVVASAGNTARAFIRVCSRNGIPLVVVVPEANLGAIWSIGAVGPTVRVIAAGGDSDYSDAIALASTIARLPGFVTEGGAQNVARRDGMGTTVLSAVDAIGEIPDHYFQAVGSGTGAIAAWEANLRLADTGAYGDRKMRLHVSQNAPFTPIHDAWTRKSPQILPIDETVARRQIARIRAKVLANRNPPYGVMGGLYDALVDTDGTTGVVTNRASAAAARLFNRLEGIDVEPAASVAVAHLIAAVRSGMIGSDQIVMLNVTGGGFARIMAAEDVRQVRPDATITRTQFDPPTVERIVKELF